MEHPTSCFCDDCLWPTVDEVLEAASELFRCLMTRIYKVPIDTPGVLQKEKEAMQTYLKLKEERNDQKIVASRTRN